MPNLKPYYDAALAADAEVKRILAEMDTAFNDGTPEGKQKALSLRPALDEAQTKAKEANQLYASMRDASLVNDSMASLFTTPPDPAQQDQKDDSPKVINRAGLKALSPVAQIQFFRAGGKVVDDGARAPS
jgi:hypothetical protein